MAPDDPTPASRCRRCGYEASPGDETWEQISAPPFSTVTQCPDCGSTDVVTGR